MTTKAKILAGLATGGFDDVARAIQETDAHISSDRALKRYSLSLGFAGLVFWEDLDIPMERCEEAFEHLERREMH